MRLSLILAVLWLAAFAFGLTRFVVRTGIRRSDWSAPFEISPRGYAFALALFVLGHAAPYLFSARRIAPRLTFVFTGEDTYRVPASRRALTTNGDQIARAESDRRAMSIAVAIASALLIACIGELSQRYCFHCPHQDPMEFLVYFYFAIFTLTTHAPRALAPLRR